MAFAQEGIRQRQDVDLEASLQFRPKCLHFREGTVHRTVVDHHYLIREARQALDGEGNGVRLIPRHQSDRDPPGKISACNVGLRLLFEEPAVHSTEREGPDIPERTLGSSGIRARPAVHQGALRPALWQGRGRAINRSSRAAGLILAFIVVMLARRSWPAPYLDGLPHPPGRRLLRCLQPQDRAPNALDRSDTADLPADRAADFICLKGLASVFQ